MNTCYVVRSSRPAGLFSFGLLDGPQVRLCRPRLREASGGLRSRPPRYGIHEQSGLWICGLDHVRETIPFPRMLYRIYP